MLVALDVSAKVAIFVFVVTSMLGVGLGLTLSQILEPFRSTRLVLSAVAANFVLVPLLAYFITRILTLDEPLAIGILLLGSGAGAPFLPKLAEFSRANTAFAVGLMVFLMALTVIYMPIVLPLLVAVDHVSPWLVAKPLVTVMLLPLLLGLLVRARKAVLAGYLQPYLRRASTIALVLVIVLVMTANFRNLTRTMSLNVILAGSALLLGSIGCGFALGGPSSDSRRILALGTAQRDFSAALLVAVDNFRNPGVVAMLTVVALLGLCLLVPIALAFGRRAVRRNPVWANRPS
ncbi:MAG TPA: bile acid:sodium symporter [Candidatus Acidoferrales bacterium]|nr:bile acid:sodium symporter [Candidatus Acidoferrales bacterium]